MNGYEHWKAAEELLAQTMHGGYESETLQRAMVHAQLADTAAHAHPKAFLAAMAEDGTALSALPREARTPPSDAQRQATARALMGEEN